MTYTIEEYYSNNKLLANLTLLDDCYLDSAKKKHFHNIEKILHRKEKLLDDFLEKCRSKNIENKLNDGCSNALRYDMQHTITAVNLMLNSVSIKINESKPISTIPKIFQDEMGISYDRIVYERKIIMQSLSIHKRESQSMGR